MDKSLIKNSIRPEIMAKMAIISRTFVRFVVSVNLPRRGRVKMAAVEKSMELTDRIVAL